MLENLGDYYRILGVAEQPPVERSGYTVYYWFEVFRRATLTQSPMHSSCWHIVLDLYAKGASPSRIGGVIGCRELASLEPSALYRCETILQYTLCPSVGVHECWVEVHRQDEIIEAISLHMDICGYAESPPYRLVERIYIDAVRLIEGRDPFSRPLWVDVKEIMMHKPA